MIELAELLVENSPLDRVFFCNSGAEAVETAIKIARRWGHDECGGKHGIIAMQDGFHGRSLGALAATGTAATANRSSPCLAASAMSPGTTSMPSAPPPTTTPWPSSWSRSRARAA